MSLVRAILICAVVLGTSAGAASYTVKAGDTLYRVAQAHHMSAEELMELNQLESTTIEVGQVLTVPDSPTRNAAGTPPKAPAASPSATDRTGVVRAASMKFLGIPYRLGANGPHAMDCSSFTQAVMATLGIRLPRTSREQFRTGTPVGRSDLRPGDLIFFNTLGNGVSHVGIFLGNGQFAHANSYTGRTTIDELKDAYYTQRYLGARRVLPGG